MDTWRSPRHTCVTRRRLLGHGAPALVTAAVSAAAGCRAGTGSPAAQQSQAQRLPPGELEFWNHWADTSPGGQGWQVIIEKFQAAYPGVTVRRVVPGSGLFEKVLAAVAAGTPPQLIDLSPTQYAASAARGILVKLDPYMRPGSGVTREIFLPAALEIAALPDGMYATPSEFGTLLLFYNADLLQQAGARLPEASWRWDREFLETARQVTQSSGPPEAQRFGVEHVTNGWWNNQWWVLVWSNGGDLLSKDFRKCLLTEAPAVEGIQFLADLKHKWGVVPTEVARPTGPQGRPFFESGRLAFHPSGSFYYAQIKERAGFRWGVAPIPHGRAGSTPGTNAWLVGIGAGSKYQEAAWAFIAFYLQPEHYAEFLRFVSWMPPIKAIERPPLVDDPSHWSAMTAAARTARSLPTIPQMDDVLALMRQGLAPVFDSGTNTARAAVEELCPRVDALLSAGR